LMRIFVFRLKGDDPKKSTALKLVRLGLARLVKSPVAVPRGVLTLYPFSDRILTPADRGIIEDRGILVIDGSWNTELEEIKKVANRIKGNDRVLPVLKAGNPINYGILTKLSSAEAVAGALYITGFREKAVEIMSKFKWGSTFLNLNRELLEKYSYAKGPEEIIRIQRDVLRKHGLINTTSSEQ